MIKALIVEDHLDSRELLAIQLRRFGYEVAEAGSGEEALSLAESEQPDVIIMDLGLPGINGIDATALLKQNPRTTAIPVIAYTAWSSNEFKTRALQAGAAEFLAKPARADLIRATIDRLVSQRANPDGSGRS
jgi:CheY-like chemotaxis protein